MCGICGFVDETGRRSDASVILTMREVLRHRGPDDAGIHIDRGVALGHRRLSIIDPEHGAQPMASENGDVQLVFNGEIYNYVELRNAHLGSGGRSRTASDTEVILHLYEKFGDACVTHFNGMFAFALWDRRRRRLLLARDRAGEKPLYYTLQNGVFVFASELKSVLEHPAVEATVDPRGVDEFMTYGYVQSPRTIFSEIFRLPPAHTLVWHNGRITCEPYWQLRFEPDTKTPDREHVANVRSLLEDSVRLRLRSDVPLGVLLSGGLDSSTVAALLARNVGRIKTFSIGFDDGPAFNELAYARRVARLLGSDHHEMILEPHRFQEFIPRFVYYMDEPVTEAPGIPLHYVCQLAATKVKVVLSGEGADELFCGYPVYRRMQQLERYRRWLPSPVRAAVAWAAHRAAAGTQIEKYIQLAQIPLEQRYLNAHLYDIRLRDRLYGRDFLASLAGRDPWQASAELFDETRGLDPLSRMLSLDTRSWLANDILTKADRMSMANSIELRVPFLDHRLMEYAARVPSRLKQRGRRTKHILKEAVRDLLPTDIIDRGKMGFPTPLSRMFRGGLRPYVTDLLSSSVALTRGYFRPEVVRALVSEHLAGSANHESVLWRLIVLEEWHRQIASREMPMAGASVARH